MVKEGPKEYISLQTASELCNYSQEYLSLRARQGKLKSMKFGRNWVTTQEWLNDYLKSVKEYNGNHRNGGKELVRAEDENQGYVKFVAPPENLPTEGDFKKAYSKNGFDIFEAFSFLKTKTAILGLATIVLAGAGILGRDYLKSSFEDLNPVVLEINQASVLAGKEILNDAGQVYSQLPLLAVELNKPFNRFINVSVEGAKNKTQQLVKIVYLYADTARTGGSEIFDQAAISITNAFKNIQNDINDSIADSEKRVMTFSNAINKIGFESVLIVRNSISNLSASVNEFPALFGRIGRQGAAAIDSGITSLSAGASIFQDYGQWISEKISVVWKGIKNSPQKIGQWFASSFDFIKERFSLIWLKFQIAAEKLKLIFVAQKEQDPKISLDSLSETSKILSSLEERVQRLEREGLTIREIEVSKITKIEPVKEITKEILKIDDISTLLLKNLVGQLETRTLALEGQERNVFYSGGGTVNNITNNITNYSTNILDSDWLISGASMYSTDTVALVGIGTTTPVYTLDVYGDARLGSSAASNIYIRGISNFNNNFFIDASGNIATGTWQGNVIGSLYGGTGTSTFSWTGIPYITSGVWGTTTAGGGTLSTSSAITANYFPFWTYASGTLSGTSTIYFSSGNIGIGTSGPSALLDIWASSTVTALSVFQNGTGTIVDFRNATGSVFVINNAGAITTGNWQATPIATTYGGTGTSTASWTGIPYITAGTWGTTTAGGSVSTSSAITSLNFPYWVNATGSLSGTSTLYFLNGYIGIGTTTPSALLDIWASSTVTALSVFQNGTGTIADLKYGGTSVVTLASDDRLRYREGLMQTWGDFQAVVLADFENNSVTNWTTSDTTNTKLSATTTQFKVNDYGFAITTVVGGSNNDTATSTPAIADWSSYERVSFWILAQYTSTSSGATTSDAIVFRFRDSGGTTTQSTTTIKEFGKWQYQEVDISSVASADKDNVISYGFQVLYDYGSPIFYIDHIRLYDSDERSSEIFVDKDGVLVMQGRGGVEITRPFTGAGQKPSIKVDSGVVEFNQPISVNVGGDVGFDYDIYFSNTGLSTISSYGPLTISAGNNWTYQNLTLKTGGTGDIIMDIASSTLGFKITGPGTTTFGAYVFRVKPTGALDIGATTTIAGNLIPAASSTYSLGSATSKWANLFVATTTVGDIVFANQFRLTEALTLGINPPESLVFKNASNTTIMSIDENGNLVVGRKIVAQSARLQKLEMVDQADGSTWCTWIENGQWIKTQGECDVSGFDSQVIYSASPPTITESGVGGGSSAEPPGQASVSGTSTQSSATTSAMATTSQVFGATTITASATTTETATATAQP